MVNLGDTLDIRPTYSQVICLLMNGDDFLACILLSHLDAS